jgi:hypothetical protein
MVRPSIRKRLLYVITAYLVFATLGTFTSIAFDASLLDNLAGESQAQGIFLTSLDCFVCNPAIIETKDNQFSSQRHCLLRTIIPLGLLAAGSDLLCSAIRPITKTAVKADKNNILVKLRI